MSTNSNSDEFVPIKFQPMPKRFMVFMQLENPSAWYEVKTCYGHEICIGLDGRLMVSGAGRDTATEELLINNSKTIICQSTNLFDKDGKEIFEGSLMEDTGEGGIGVVKYDVKTGSYYVGMKNRSVEFDCGVPDTMYVIGHILSDRSIL